MYWNPTRTCENCAYGGRPPYKSPCHECFAFCNWEEPKEPTTNADRIRSMTDDELAEAIRYGISSDACDYCKHNNGHCDGSPCRGKAEADIIIEWLQQPAEDL